MFGLYKPRSVHRNFVKRAASCQNQQCGCAPSEDSDQPGHPPSLMPSLIVFAVRMKKAWVLSYPLSAQRRLWSDWADAQADLSLRWAHSHNVGFAMRWVICRVVDTNVMTSRPVRLEMLWSTPRFQFATEICRWIDWLTVRIPKALQLYIDNPEAVERIGFSVAKTNVWTLQRYNNFCREFISILQNVAWIIMRNYLRYIQHQCQQHIHATENVHVKWVWFCSV